MEKLYSLICCRVSSEKQVRDGHGLESQKQRCKKYSDENGYTYEDTPVIYKDGKKVTPLQYDWDEINMTYYLLIQTARI